MYERSCRMIRGCSVDRSRTLLSMLVLHTVTLVYFGEKDKSKHSSVIHCTARSRPMSLMCLLAYFQPLVFSCWCGSAAAKYLGNKFHSASATLHMPMYFACHACHLCGITVLARLSLLGNHCDRFTCMFPNQRARLFAIANCNWMEATL